MKAVSRQKAKFWLLPGVFFAVLVVTSFAQDLDPLAEKIRSGSNNEKREALFQIRNLQTAEASRMAVPALLDKNEIVRATAAYSVIFLPAAEAVRVLLPLLKDKSVLVRKETAYALGKLKDPFAVQSLLTTLQNDQDLEVKAAAVLALGEIGNVSAVEALLKVLQNKPHEAEDFLRRAAARSIGQIAQLQQFNSVYVVTPESLLPEKYDTLVNLKYSNLAESFPGFRQSFNVLLTILQSTKESDDVRREAAFALGTIGDPQAIEILSANLNAKDYYLVEICRESLQKVSR